MRIKKRNGEYQAFMPNKILSRIKQHSKDLNVDSDSLFKEVIPLIYDDMTTTELDEQNLQELNKQVKLEFLEECGLLDNDEGKINIATLYEGRTKYRIGEQ